MDEASILWTIIAAVLSSMLGAGAIGRILLGSLKQELRREFVSVEALNNWGSRVNGLETVAVQARDAADEAQAAVAMLTQEQRHHAATTTRELHAVTEDLRAVVNEFRTVAERLIRLEERWAALSDQRRRTGGQP